MSASSRPALHARTRSRSKSISDGLSAMPLYHPQPTSEGYSPTATSPVADPIAHTASAVRSLASGTPTSPSKDDNPPSIKLNGSEALFKKDQDEQAMLRRRAGQGAEKDRTGMTKRPKKRGGGMTADMLKSRGFWKDWSSMRWIVIPSAQLPVLLFPILMYLNHRLLTSEHIAPSLAQDLFGRKSIIDPTLPNLFEPFLFVSHPSPPGAEAMELAKNAALGHVGSNGAGVEGQTYMRGWKDILFILYHIVAFSFIRQTVTLYFLRPIMKRLGIRGGKMVRALEQGYAFIYWGVAGYLGLYVMKGLPIWYYKTEPMWTQFPTFHMSRLLKTYYLWQFSYWLQQSLLLVAKVEKPRKDYKELVAHHIVTLWLIGWSYFLTFTYIGVAIFITMDLSDHFFALAKLVNYVDERWSYGPLIWFIGVWTYGRHYLNIKLLKSVWYEFDLIPEYERRGLDLFRNKLATPWLKYQIFLPIFLLQCINLFWYFLIWRVVFRALFTKNLADERSEDEDSGDEVLAELDAKKNK